MRIVSIVKRLMIVATIAVVAISCFKDEKYDTLMRIAIYSQNVSDDPIMKADCDIESYAFNVVLKDNWEVKTWEDALERRITNVDRPAETLTTPDVVGVYDPLSEYQVTMQLTSPVVFMVVVDKTNKIYAYREYEVGLNLPEVLTHLHMYAWRKTGSANGWTVVNPFPDEAREPLVPKEDDTEQEQEQEQEQQ